MSATFSKTNLLNDILDDLASNLTGDVNGSAVVSADGIAYAAHFSSNINIDRVGAIAATTMGISHRVGRDLFLGSTNETIIQFDDGFFMICPVNEKCLLAIHIRKGGNLGMTRLEARDSVNKIKSIMN